MPALDLQSEAIVDAYLMNGGNQSDAWKVGHPNSKAKPTTIAVEASKFFAQPNVRLRIVERQSEVASQSAALTALTLDSHVKELITLRDLAKEKGMIGPAVKAEELLGQLGQHYVKRVHATGTVDHQHTHEAKPVSETVSWLEGLLGERPARKPAKPLPN